MKNVIQLRVESHSKVIAVMRAGDTEWSDPHGGTFTTDEQSQFTGVAIGNLRYVRLHKNTKWEQVTDARLTCRFI